MKLFYEILPYLQTFFQLNFLFSGLEVSSTTVLVSRLSIFVIFGTAFIWGSFKLLMKFLDCVQTFVTGISPIPKSFFLLLFLVIPLSPESVGARWIGYILLILCFVGIAAAGALFIVAWKYGVDQALRLVNQFGKRQEVRSPANDAPGAVGTYAKS